MKPPFTIARCGCNFVAPTAYPHDFRTPSCHHTVIRMEAGLVKKLSSYEQTLAQIRDNPGQADAILAGQLPPQPKKAGIMKQFVKIIFGFSVAFFALVAFVAVVGGAQTSKDAVTPSTESQSAPSQTPAAPVLQIPQSEQTFVNIISQAQQQYSAAGNDMTKGAARHACAQALCHAFSTEHVEKWAGTISTLDATEKGNGVLSINLTSDLMVSTNNNEFSDSLGTPTLIPVDSALFQKVSAMKVGDTVYFSGDLQPSDTDCFDEQSLTTDGSMQTPDFLIRYTDVHEAASQ